MIRCRNCNNWFEPNTHNQIYDSAECRKKATNEKIMQRYYEKKEEKGSTKHCRQCGTKLNQYNDSDVCLNCNKDKNVNNKDVLEEIKHGLRGFER